MFGGKGWRLFTISGVPIKVDTSWVVIAVVVVWAQWASDTGAGMGNGPALGLALLTACLFFGCILLHEGAHAVMCRAHGIEVQSITLFALGGFTEAHVEEKGARPEFLVAIVGPLTSLAMGAGLWLLAPELRSTDIHIAGTVRYIGSLNMLLAAFNMLPGYPLDGGRVLRAAVLGITGDRMKAAKVAGWSGQIAGAALIGYGLLALSGAIGGGFNPFLIFIGMIIFQAARGSGGRERLLQMLAGGTVADAMTAPPTAVPSELDLTTALDRYLRGHEDKTFPVVDGGNLVGVLTFQAAAAMGRHDPLRPVRDAMLPLGDIRVVQADAPLDLSVQDLGTGAALVLRGSELVGAISANDVGRWATARSAPPAPAPGQTPGRGIPPRPDP